MAELFLQRCLNHAQREAAAKCRSCGHFFCRECISEHDGRVICANCVKALVAKPFYKGKGIERVLQIAHCCLGLIAAWFLFYMLGEALLKLPSSFHDGTIWENGIETGRPKSDGKRSSIEAGFQGAAAVASILWPGAATPRRLSGECPSGAQQYPTVQCGSWVQWELA